MANSAFYGLTNRVETIRRAVVVLGFDTVRLLAMATSVFDTLNKRQQFALDPDDFWMHSLGAARAARLLSKRCVEPVNAGAAFTAGLLHDVGKYLLALVLGTEYRKIVQKAEESRASLWKMERSALRTTHDRVGAWLAEKWRFPKSVTATIRHFKEASAYVGSYRTQIAVVNLSDNLSRTAGFGNAGDYDRPEFEPKCLRFIGLRQPIEDLVQELQPYVDNARELIHILR
jgi:HD-like signal output (HDOD) protein